VHGPRTIVIAGGSGFLGIGLARHLADTGARVVILSRRPPASGPWEHARWDGRTVGPWASTLDNAAALINLAGRSVDCVKTPDNRDEILRSRVESTLALGAAVRMLASPPPVWIQMSTAHIYGDPPRVLCDESSPTGLDLAPDVGRAWEEAFAKSILPSQHGVVLRTSFVVGPRNPGGAGALGRLRLLARAGLGGRVGSGQQGFSWLHARDFHRIIDRALADETTRGVYIASSPSPVSQRDFMRSLRAVAGGLGALGLALPAPAWLVRLGAPLLLRTDPELALYGRYVTPRRLLNEGFSFEYPDLAPALASIFGTR